MQLARVGDNWLPEKLGAGVRRRHWASLLPLLAGLVSPLLRYQVISLHFRQNSKQRAQTHTCFTLIGGLGNSLP